MSVKGAFTALLISFLLLPHLVLIYSVLGTEEPGWSHQVREVPVPPRPEGGKVIVVDQSGRGDFRSISEAVDAARPGDRVLVMPGVYRESVTVSSKPWLEIVGVDRDSVVLDGENRLGNGIYVVFSPHVTVANLTVRNYLGNGIFYVNSDYFRVERVRAENNRVYGINFLASEKGVVSRVIAYGSGDSGIYVGEVSERCECVVEYSEAFNNTLGYSGTRANGVTIRYSHFHDNGIGIAPNTLLPNLRLFLTGRWPLMVWASNNVIEHNLIENNNNRNLRAAGGDGPGGQAEEGGRRRRRVLAVREGRAAGALRHRRLRGRGGRRRAEACGRRARCPLVLTRRAGGARDDGEHQEVPRGALRTRPE
jgi:hypothetical protein